MQNWLTSNRAEYLVYIYTNNKLLRKQPSANPMAWYENNMLSKDLMSNVGESANESDSLDKDLITLDETNENEIKHDPFEFPHHDEIPFLKLLSNLIVW